MRHFAAGFLVAAMAGAAFQAKAQPAYLPPYPDDMACRRYAAAQTALLRDQPPSQPVGSSLIGAGLGAAPPSTQDTAAYAQQRYNAAYAQCMAPRPGPAAAPPPSFAPSGASANDLNRQQLYGQPPGQAPAYPGYPPPSR